MKDKLKSILGTRERHKVTKGRKKAIRLDDDRLTEREGKRTRRNHVYFHWGKVRRYFEGNVGRPWDEVRADLVQLLGHLGNLAASVQDLINHEVSSSEIRDIDGTKKTVIFSANGSRLRDFYCDMDGKLQKVKETDVKITRGQCRFERILTGITRPGVFQYEKINRTLCVVHVKNKKVQSYAPATLEDFLARLIPDLMEQHGVRNRLLHGGTVATQAQIEKGERLLRTQSHPIAGWLLQHFADRRKEQELIKLKQLEREIELLEKSLS